MVCSSSFFVFAFLPAVILGNLILKPWRGAQNVWLVIASLFFYAWGEPRVVFVMTASILVNYIFGLLVGRYRENRRISYILITLMLICNLSALFVFKYMNFVFGIAGIDTDNWGISLPIGISFYTFQAISYVIDVYRGDGEAQKNPLNVALYISFFPQLVAGPIVRYRTIEEQIRTRKETAADFAAGVQRFITGLAKKLILANSFAPVADYMFGHIDSLSVISAWLGAICYTLQIYFDFSGYSDMAIGMGRMFGFHFQENFNYPYISGTITEFWRRWHISLGTWFRDYIYFPMGGSRVDKKGRLVFNLFVVWTLTGIWHGANWTFLFWGWWYFVILTVEKLTKLPKWIDHTVWRIPYQIFTMFCVIAGWVFFRADSLAQAVHYIGKMWNPAGIGLDKLSIFWVKDLWLLLLVGIVCSTPVAKKLEEICAGSRLAAPAEFVKAVWLLVLFVLCIGFMVNSSYNPFIYFNF